MVVFRLKSGLHHWLLSHSRLYFNVQGHGRAELLPGFASHFERAVLRSTKRQEGESRNDFDGFEIFATLLCCYFLN